MIFGDLSGQISSLSNPTTKTSFSLTAGGYAQVPVLVERVKGIAFKVTMAGVVTFDATTTSDVLIYLMSGDPSNIGSATSISNAGLGHGSPNVFPYLFETYCYWDSVGGKLSQQIGPVGVGNTITFGGGAISFTSPTIFDLFPAAYFLDSKAGNSVTMTEFKVSII